MPKNDRFIFEHNDDYPNGGRWWFKDAEGTRLASPEFADFLQDFDDVEYDRHGQDIAWHHRDIGLWWNENTKEYITSNDVIELANTVTPPPESPRTGSEPPEPPPTSYGPPAPPTTGAPPTTEAPLATETPLGTEGTRDVGGELLGNIGGTVGAGGVPYGPIPGLNQEDIIYRMDSLRLGQPVVDEDGNLVVDWPASWEAAKAREALLYSSPQRFSNLNEYLTYLLEIGNWEEANRVREFSNQLTASETEQNRIREAPKGLEELIVNALVEGDTEKAQALRNFQNQPTATERFDRAMQYAKSPADQLTLIAMQRGQLPISTRAPLFDLQGNINPDYRSDTYLEERIPWPEVFLQRGGTPFERNAYQQEAYKQWAESFKLPGREEITPDGASEAVASEETPQPVHTGSPDEPASPPPFPVMMASPSTAVAPDNKTAIRTRFGYGFSPGDYNRPAASTGFPPSVLIPSAPATGGFGSADMNMLAAPGGRANYSRHHPTAAQEDFQNRQHSLGAYQPVSPLDPRNPDRGAYGRGEARSQPTVSSYPDIGRPVPAIPVFRGNPPKIGKVGMQAPPFTEYTGTNQAGVGARNTPYKRPWLNQPGHTNPIDWDARANPTGIASHIGGQVSAPLTMPKHVPGVASIGAQTLIPPSPYPGNIGESLSRRRTMPPSVGIGARQSGQIRPVGPRAEIPKTGGAGSRSFISPSRIRGPNQAGVGAKQPFFTPEYLSGQTRSKMSQAEADTRFGTLALHIGEDAARQFMTDEAASTSISRRRGGTSRIRSAPSRISRRR